MTNSIEFKAMPGQVNIDEAQGIVECFVAGIGNKDSVGDVLVTGAFSKSLMRRKPRVVWGHNWNDPIGKVLEIYEVPPGDRRLPAKMLNAGIGGLYARVQFNLNSEKGKEAFANVAFFGQEQEWSIGYKTLDSIFDPNIQANVLKEVELYEVSPVLHGANQLTGTISVKSDEVSADPEQKWGMMGPNQMMNFGQKPNVIVIREQDDDQESEKPIFAEGLAQPLGGEQRQRLEREIMQRTGSMIKLIEATENTAVFSRMSPNGGAVTYRIGYHTPDNYVTFMFGKPELANGGNVNSSGSRVVVPSQMPSMPMQVKPNYEQNYGVILPKSDEGEKSDLAEQLNQIEDLLISEIEEKVGRTLNKRNLAKLKTILENLQEVIASAEKEDMETKGYLIPVEIENAFHTKSILDPIFDYHRVESVVTENGIVITSGVTKDLVEAIDNAQKGIGRNLGGGLGKGRAAGRAAFARFDPNAWDGDNDGIVQEGTPFERPAIPGVNDFSTRGKVNVRRVMEATTGGQGFASASSSGRRGFASATPSGEPEIVTNFDESVEKVLDRAAKTILGDGNPMSVTQKDGTIYEWLQEDYDRIIDSLKEILSPISTDSPNDGPGAVLSQVRKNLVDKLSDENFIESFKSRKALTSFIDGIYDSVEEHLNNEVQKVERTQKASEVKDFEELISELQDDFRSSIEKISSRAEDYWAKRTQKQYADWYGRSELPLEPERAKSEAKEMLDDLIGALGNGLQGVIDEYYGLDFASWLATREGITITSDTKEKIRNGEISPEDLMYELEQVAERIQHLDPSREPEDIVNELRKAIKKGGENNPILKKIADEMGDEEITGGDLIDYLKDTQRNSPFNPKRGSAEREKLRGFASASGRTNYDNIGIDRNASDPSLEPGVLEGESADKILEAAGDAQEAFQEGVLPDILDEDPYSILDAFAKQRKQIFEKLSPELRKRAEEETSGMSSEEVRDWMQSLAENNDELMDAIGTTAVQGIFDGKMSFGEKVDSDIHDSVLQHAEDKINRTNRGSKLVAKRNQLGFASSSSSKPKEKLESDYNSVDMTLEEYGQLQDALNSVIQKLEDGDFGADEEINKLKELTEKIEDSRLANDMIPLDNEEITNYLGMLESMRDSGVGIDDVDKKDKETIDSLINALKEAQKTGSSESEKLKEAGTRLSTGGGAASSTRGSAGRRRLTSDGTLSPSKKLEITLDDDAIGLLNEEIDMLMDYTKNKQPLMEMRKILENAKNGKFEVTPEQFDSITSAIEDAIDNGVVTSDIYGVLHQAAEALDGKYDINEVVKPSKMRKGFASSSPTNNGAPSDITERMQKEYIFWARRQGGLRVARSIVEDYDKNGGTLKASQWKALRTMYANMGPGSSRGGGFASANRSQPTAGIRGGTGPQGITPLPYVYNTSGWKKVGGAGGLNEASQMMDMATGKKYYVKHTRQGEEFRGESEILTSKLYQLLGIPTIKYERGIHNGKLQRVSEWDPGIRTVSHREMSRDPKFKKSVQSTLIANAWLANWDGTGNMSNIVQNSDGEAVMADSGGGLLFRAQRYSGMKGQGGTTSFGPQVEEVWNLIHGTTRSGARVQQGVSDAYYKDIEPEEIARQVKQLSQITDDDIRKLVSQTISNPEDGDRLAQILIARRDWISDHWKTGKFVEKPEDTSLSDASASRARPFASASGRTRGGFASSVDGPGDDERGGGRVRGRGLGEAVPGGALEKNTRNRTGGRALRPGEEHGPDTKFQGKKFEEVKPDNWEDLSLDERWQWAITYGNPENAQDKNNALSPVEYKKLITQLSEEMDKEDLDAMSPAERRAEIRRRREEQKELDSMGFMPEGSEKPKTTKPKSEPSDEVKPAKIKKSKNAEDAKTERENRLDKFLEAIDAARNKFDSDQSESDDHRDVWDKVSDSIQEGGYDFSLQSLDRAIEALDEYIGEYEDSELTPGERANVRAAILMRKHLAGARAGYAEDEWIPGSTKGKGGGFASSSRSPQAAAGRKMAQGIKDDLKKIQGSGKPGTMGFASTSSGGKTMITDEATFFRNIETSLDKEIRRARRANDTRAVKGLSKLAEIIRRDEASKTGSRRTNVGSIYLTVDEADEVLDGLMFALDTQLEDGGEKRVGWYSKLIEMIASAAKSTFIDKTTKQITETTRTATNSRGQRKKINIVPEA